MTLPLQIHISRRAAIQIEEVAAWWAVNRLAAPGAIHQELEHAFSLLAIQPAVGARALNARLSGVRRLHLSRIHYHLYYRVTTHAIEVLAFWHTSRDLDPGI